MRGIKQTALLALTGLTVSACMAPLPGGETGPFAPGNTLTFYYQSVLTDPPEQAQTFECGDQFIARTCVRMSNGASFQMEPTENGVAFGNETLRIVMALDAGGVPSGLGQMNNLATGESTGMRWVSLPS